MSENPIERAKRLTVDAPADHEYCWDRITKMREVVNIARTLLPLATKDALGPLFDPESEEEQAETDADYLWNALHALDHSVKDYDEWTERQERMARSQPPIDNA